MVFPASQVHIVNRDDMTGRPEEVMEGVHDFIGIPRRPLGAKVTGHRENVNTHRKDTLEQSTLELMRDFYRPHNIHLSRLLGWQLDSWDS